MENSRNKKVERRKYKKVLGDNCGESKLEESDGKGRKEEMFERVLEGRTNVEEN